MAEDTSATSPVVVKVEADGPLEVQGPVTIEGSDGVVLDVTERTWLCRCGHSNNKPFCDGSHRRTGFNDPGLGTS
ncbi:MAG: CDGSH iron-sulfur domain-containing protein [Actinobacteria bacterium]|nr:CDGSH iron-sulfur domain-containing protein [Actinomycetota bacterium]MCB9412772.1 CDGSH iron-sulfur domain-containing protein [Actinomycetota bacterium]